MANFKSLQKYVKLFRDDWGIDSNGNLLVACKDYNLKITKVLSFGEILPFSDLGF
jgi:hypothetical protein